MRKGEAIIVAIFGALALGMGGSSRTAQEKSFDDLWRHSGRRLSRLWEKRVDGLITDVAGSAGGELVVVATQPDPDRATRKQGYWIHAFDGVTGGKRFSIRIRTIVKGLSVARDGSRVFYHTYGDEVVALSAAPGSAGKTLWKHFSPCKPVPMADQRAVICFHDDDAEPRVAFEVLSWGGKKLGEFPIQEDVLHLRVGGPNSPGLVALSLTGGEMVLFVDDGKPFWSKPRFRVKLGAEIAHFGLADFRENDPVIVAAVQHGLTTRDVSLVTISGTGKVLARAQAPALVDKIELTADGKRAWTYSHSRKGQQVASLSIGGSEIESRWVRRDTHASEYPVGLSLSGDDKHASGILVAERGAHERKAALVAIDADGDPDWVHELKGKGGAYVYGHMVGSSGEGVSIATDDSVISRFK